MSYRRTTLAGLSFDESLPGYGLGEDLFLSFAVGQRGRLVMAPGALVVHHLSAVNRGDLVDITALAAYRRYNFVRQWPAHLSIRRFWISIVGQVALLLWRAGLRRDRDAFRLARAIVRGAKQGLTQP
jgi:GT2 family glycosyltransferase